MRSTRLLVGLVCLLAPGASVAAQPQPQHVLAGAWRYKSTQVTLVEKSGRVIGRTRETRSVHGCRVRAHEVVYRDFRFLAAQGAKDVWKGMSVVLDEQCKRREAPSKIVVQSDSRFTESTRGLAATRFRRVKPPVRDDDPVLTSWMRNGARVDVTRQPSGYVGRAHEDYVIANGCTIAAGTAIWNLTPSAPDRYEGSIQTFLQPPGCGLGALTPSSWRLSGDRRTLTRVAADGQHFAYSRAP